MQAVWVCHTTLPALSTRARSPLPRTCGGEAAGHPAHEGEPPASRQQQQRPPAARALASSAAPWGRASQPREVRAARRMGVALRTPPAAVGGRASKRLAVIQGWAR
jgi:hypothetical protein